MNAPKLTALPEGRRWPSRSRRLLWVLLAGLICAAILFAHWAWPVSDSDREDALKLALNALISGAPVETPDGPESLVDRAFVLRARDRIYFVNKTTVGDAVFLAHGLKRIPPGKQIDVDHGDVVVRASYQGLHGERTRHLQFSYVFGSQGAQGYEVLINRGPGGRKILFVHAWVS